jgi:hypothetical protein
MRVKRPLVQQLLAGITLFLVLGALSTIWPAIMTLLLGVLLLLQSCSAEQTMTALLWTEVGH